MNTLNLVQKGHFEVTFARSSVKTGSPVCKTPLLQVVIAHNLLNYVHVELFGKKRRVWGMTYTPNVNKWSTSGKKVVKKRCFTGVTDSIPIHEYNHLL